MLYVFNKININLENNEWRRTKRFANFEWDVRTAHSVSTRIRPSNELDLFLLWRNISMFSHVLWPYAREYISSFGWPEKIYLFCEFTVRSNDTIRSMQKFPLVIVCNDNATASRATATVLYTDSRAQTFDSYLFEVCLLLLVRFTNTAYFFSAFSFVCSFLSVVIVATTPALSFKWP